MLYETKRTSTNNYCREALAARIFFQPRLRQTDAPGAFRERGVLRLDDYSINHAQSDR